MTVVIGSQSSVPAPGDPIVSPWYQDTARKLVHQFASVAARNAWTTRPTGAMAHTADDNVVAFWNGTAWVGLVKLTGDAMSGSLQVGGNPTASACGTVMTAGAADGRIVNDCGFTGESNLQLIRRTPAAAVGQGFIQFKNNTNLCGNITVATGTSVAYNTSSDPRLKERTGDADDAATLVTELGHKVYRGRWKADEGDGQEWVFFNSTDVEAVAPFAVQGEADATDADGNIVAQQVNHSALVPLLTAALAQALDRIAALESA